MAGRRDVRGWTLALGALVSAAGPLEARANSAAPVTYAIQATGATVQICADPYGLRAPCPADGLLRVDAAGHAVLIATCDAEQCFVDECVPPGRYQYGLKTPFACSPHSSGTYYYVTADLTASDAGCQRTLPAPTPHQGALPWGNHDLICGYQGGHGCGTAGAGTVLGLNALVLLAGLLVWRSRRTARHP